MEGEKRQPKRLRKGPPASALASVAPVEKKDDGIAVAPLPSAPSDACGICLEVTQERGVLSSCDHVFCFDCIMEWAKVTNRCPLCKAKFNSVTPRALKEGAGKVHKRKVYRVLDKEQRVEWEPEEGEWLVGDDLSEGSDDSFIVDDGEEDDDERAWRPVNDEGEDWEEEAEFSDEPSADDDSDGEAFVVLPASPPRRRRRYARPTAPVARTQPAPTATRSPMRRYFPTARNTAPTPAAAASASARPPPRPATAKPRADKVEIQTPDGRTISVRRSKYSATSAPARNEESDSWSMFERSRSLGSAKLSAQEQSNRPNKRRGAVSSHALIAQAMPRLTFQRTASSSSVSSNSSSNNSVSVPIAAQTTLPLTRAVTMPAAPSTPPKLAVAAPIPAVDQVIPPTPPKSAVRFVPEPIIPPSSPAAIAATPPRPDSVSPPSSAVSSPFKPQREERAALKHTVAERVKRMLTPFYRDGRVSLVQFKLIARAATTAFVNDGGKGPDLREHLRQAVLRELGVSLGSLERKVSNADSGAVAPATPV